MMFGFSSSKIVRGPIRTAVASLLISLCAFAAQADPPAESSVPDSVSIGLPMDGSLVRGQVLPKKGSGYRMMRKSADRKARFGVLELVMIIKDAAHKVQQKHRGSVLAVADLSARKGGSMDHHGSHQSGRDVDLAFFMLEGGDPAAAAEEFVPFDTNGYSIDPPMRYRFDVARNWAVVEAFIESSRAEVQWIFVADHLKRMLLAHAEAAGARRSTIQKARQILRQPGKKAHWDHFHVRIYCPDGDAPQCRDVGPKWAWAR